jgi:hypothetical protein
MDPEGEAARAPKKWEEVVRYFAGIPPAERNPRGFYLERGSPDDFKHQLRAIYCYTLNSLSGFAELNENGTLLPSH